MRRDTADRIRTKCTEIADLLAAKNRAYGNSALEPLNIFGRGDAEANIAARLDDKLARVTAPPAGLVSGQGTLHSAGLQNRRGWS